MSVLSAPPLRHAIADEKGLLTNRMWVRYLNSLAQFANRSPGATIASYVVGDFLVADAADSLARFPAVAAGRVLRAAGVGVIPAYSTFTVPDTFALGDIPHASALNVVTALTVGSAGQVVRSTGTVPAYSTATYPNTVTAGDVLIATAGNVIGSLAVGGVGTVVRSGGAAPAYSTFTIPDTYARGDILAASAANILTALTLGTVGKVPRSDGTDLVYSTFTIPDTGTSGGILGYTATGTLASSALLAANQLVLGGGAGATPSTLGSLGITTTVLHGNAAGAPSFAAVSLTADVTGDLPFSNIVQVATASVLGRNTAGTGDIEVLATLPSAVQDNITRLGTIVSIGAPLGVAYGGTGLSSLTLNRIPYGGSGGTAPFQSNDNFNFDGSAFQVLVAATHVFGPNASQAGATATTLVISGQNSANAGFSLRQGVTERAGLTAASDGNTYFDYQGGFRFRESTGYVVRLIVASTGEISITNASGTGLTVGSGFSMTLGNAGIGTATFPSTGSFGLVFGDGTALSGMGGSTAGLYADGVAGTVHMVAISEAGVTMQLTGAANNTLAAAVQDTITRLGTVTVGVWSATDVAVAAGGTGLSTFGGTNTLLYTTAADVLSSIATANSGVLVTSGAGVPSIATDIPTAVTIGTAYIYRVGGTDIALADGGLNASLTASVGGILYSTATAGAILPGTATAGQIVQSGASAAPTWSTATYPATVTISRLLYASAANVISDLATANNGVLITSGAGVPSISSTLPNAVQDNITRLGPIATNLDVSGTVTALTANNAQFQLQQATTELTGLTGASMTATNLIPAGAFLVGATIRVTTLITGATSFDVGDGTDVDRWGSAIAVAAGTTTTIASFTASGFGQFTAANNVVLTANGANFTAGAVRITAHYLNLVAATS